MLELIFSSECPYCRAAARAVRAVDIGGHVELTPIESDRGERLVENHHGEYQHAPHLFTESLVYYGILPTAKGLVKEIPKEYVQTARGRGE